VPLFDFPLEQLRAYVPARVEPPDFDVFWRDTLDAARSHPIEARFEAVNVGLKTLETFDVTFNGYGAQPVKAWLTLPRDRTEPLPCVVEYLGYGGGRDSPLRWLTFASAGYAHLLMDTRGQGSTWSRGDTPDPELDGGNPQHPGFMTRGIFDPKTYYYRRVFTDAVRAVDAARAHASVDASRVVVTGGSQGGGISIAVAALEPSVMACMPDVPFLCHYRRATEITESAPYVEIANFLRIHRGQEERVFQTLAYFDGVNFAARAASKALFSVALMDPVCPPSTVYAAFNHWVGEKEISLYPYNRHEGGEVQQTLEKLRFLERLLG
jgi:cephalosporin-C deacetylase